MKYIIWGAGNRGKRALDILGSDRVLFFVDSNPQKAGSIYCGKTVEEPDKINFVKEDYIVLISPAEGGKSIARKLKENGIYKYFLFDDCPYGIDLDNSGEGIFDKYSVHPGFDTCGIYGTGWFSLCLYDYLRAQNVKVCIVGQAHIDQRLLDHIEKDYVLKSLECAMGEVQALIVTKLDDRIYKVGQENRDGPQFIDINEYLEENIEFCNDKILEFKDIHKNKRCFIVATGPSLTVSDLDVLYHNHEICISMNRIYNIFSKTKWRPDYYLIEDQKMIEDLSEEIAELPLPYKFVSSAATSYWRQEKSGTSIAFNMIVQNFNDRNLGFSRNVERCIYNGRTVTYACIQLAVYMGFKEIYLLGVDFNYSPDIYAESNHFEGYHNYYRDIRLNPVWPDKMRLAFEKSREVARLYGVKIYNATRGGKLEVFCRKNFDSLFKEDKMKNLVWGLGKDVRFLLEKFDVDYIGLAFADSNRELWGKEFLHNKKILSPSEVFVHQYTYCILGSKMEEQELKGVCLKKGFKESQIISADYLISLWERWKKPNFHNTWRKYIEDSHIKVLKNWHICRGGVDAECIIKLEGLMMYKIQFASFDLLEEKKQLTIWDTDEDVLLVSCNSGETVEFKIDSNDITLKIIVCDALDRIPWCTIAYEKTHERRNFECNKFFASFLANLREMKAFYYYDEDYLAIRGMENRGTILDIGANYGQSMYAFYHLTKSKIVSIEAVPDLCEILMYFKSTFDVQDRISVINAGISNVEQELTWYESSNASESGSFDKEFIEWRKLNAVITEKKLNCRRLDDIFPKENDIWFIKADVEGLEYQVIEGGMDLIKRNYPVILIEQNSRTAEIAEKLKDYYKLYYYDLQHDKFHEKRISRLNCWFIPRENFRNDIVRSFLEGRL